MKSHADGSTRPSLLSGKSHSNRQSISTRQSFWAAPSPSTRRLVLAGVALAMHCAGCSSPLPPPTEQDLQFSQSISSAAVAFNHGDVTLAARLYENAFKRACVMNDEKSIAETAYDLAACEMDLGRYDAAGNHLAQAQYDARKAAVNGDDIALLRAKLFYIRQRDAEAQSVAAALQSAVSPEIRLEALCLLVLIATDENRSDVAAARLGELRQMQTAAAPLSPALRADVEKAQGAVEKLDGRPHDAAVHFESEAKWLAAAHRYREIVHAMARAAAAYDSAGDTALAADRYYQAGRASLALGDGARAGDWARRGIALAQGAHDLALEQLLRTLLSDANAAASP